ncbi:unnamed protein product [Gulo gulo]|uniref:Uncharacterized protein n=1 Tax=Gulo gulo TaxID=48420 RepID=A0A9X9M9S8_GULGU|nr:unnamed protein product [Gulo gulo]
MIQGLISCSLKNRKTSSALWASSNLPVPHLDPYYGLRLGKYGLLHKKARSLSVVCILSSPTRCLAAVLNPVLVFQDRKIRPGQDKTRKHKNPKIMDSSDCKIVTLPPPPSDPAAPFRVCRCFGAF